jgi:hypothetical protein
MSLAEGHLEERGITMEIKIQRRSEKIETLSLRLKQEREKLQSIETTLVSVENDIKAERRQYIDLANIHKFPDIDLDDFAVIVREDKVQSDKARNYRMGAIACLVFGTLVSSGLSILVFDFAPPLIIFLCGVGASLLIGAVVIYTLLTLIDPNPKSPETIKPVKYCVFFFSLLTLLSGALFAWLRFMEDSTIVSLLSATIASFEIGIFGLTGAFECGERVYKWSKESHDKVEALTVRRKALELEYATLTVNVQDLEYRLSRESVESESASQEEKEMEGQRR